MADETGINWADSTFNPWIGCTKVGPGCDHCYAEADFDLRKHRAKWGPGNPRSRTSPANWKKPLQWNAQPFSECMKCGWRGELRDAEIVKNPPGFHPPVDSASLCPGCHHPMLKAARRRVFCASLADVFDNEVPEQWRRDLFDLIRATPNLDWLLLTKRIGNAQRLFDDAHMVPFDGGSLYDWPANVWLGATVVNQEEADRDIPKLLAVPARVRWISAEPLLGPVDLSDYLRPKFRASSDPDWKDLHGPLDWVVVGGESGTNARPMHPEWARSLRDQCEAAGVPFLFKQHGEWISGEDIDNCSLSSPEIADADQYFRVHSWPDRAESYRVGKKAAGRLLDGKLHHEFPSRPVVIGVDTAALGADRTVYQIPAFLRRQS